MSERLNDALSFAAECHLGQVRKSENIPYIIHPMEVAAIIGGITDKEDVIIAGLLHDVVEDCNVDPRVIKSRYGSRVAALVQSETEDKLADRPPSETWMQRKEESLIMLELTTDVDVKTLWLGDKLSNLRSMWRSYRMKGDRAFEVFHQKDKKMHGWYYREIAKHLTELSHTAAYEEYATLVDKIFIQEVKK